jgi:hypothetical protein
MPRTIVLLALWAGCFAGSSFAQNAPIDQDLYGLARVHLFAIGTVGFAGQIQPGEQRLERILARPTAVRDLRRLYAIGTPEAKSYALAGLYQLDRSRFEQLSQRLQNSSAKILIERGCIVTIGSFPEIIRRIEAGRYLLFIGPAENSPKEANALSLGTWYVH